MIRRPPDFARINNDDGELVLPVLADAPPSVLEARKAAFKASRRDAPVVCASCGHQVRRRGRLQRYCSTRCRKRGHYAQKVRRGDFSTPKLSDTALGTALLQKGSKYNALQRAKTLSSPHILAPAHVLAEEVFNRPWESATSSAGVAIEIGRLRHRALVAP